jgi:hypothetical protein
MQSPIHPGLNLVKRDTVADQLFHRELATKNQPRRLCL